MKEFLKENARYFIGFTVAIFLLIVLIVILVSGNSKKAAETGRSDQSGTTTTKKLLQDYSNTGAVVRYTIDGPVNAQQDHSKVVITVGRDNTTLNIQQGYNGNVTSTQTFANSENAYDVFLASLNRAGFTKGDGSEDLKDDRGFCPTGNRYIFELIDGNRTIQRYWVTNCRSTAKTFQGAVGLNRTLFEAQVPDYNRLVRSTNL